LVVLAFLVGFSLKYVAQRLSERPGPAGFGQGVLQGAMMPCTLPTLLIGQDVPIYAERNDGVFYKLGYTMGVNVCGAVFFGLFYWRVARWRRARDSRTALPGQGSTRASEPLACP
jgi:hypothetical protein